MDSPRRVSQAQIDLHLSWRRKYRSIRHRAGHLGRNRLCYNQGCTGRLPMRGKRVLARIGRFVQSGRCYCRLHSSDRDSAEWQGGECPAKRTSRPACRRCYRKSSPRPPLRSFRYFRTGRHLADLQRSHRAPEPASAFPGRPHRATGA